jgi:hypothetical protein
MIVHNYYNYQKAYLAGQLTCFPGLGDAIQTGPPASFPYELAKLQLLCIDSIAISTSAIRSIVTAHREDGRIVLVNSFAPKVVFCRCARRLQV